MVSLTLLYRSEVRQLKLPSNTRHTGPRLQRVLPAIQVAG